jgi:hypothetical protein
LLHGLKFFCLLLHFKVAPDSILELKRRKSTLFRLIMRLFFLLVSVASIRIDSIAHDRLMWEAFSGVMRTKLGGLDFSPTIQGDRTRVTDNWGFRPDHATDFGLTMPLFSV